MKIFSLFFIPIFIFLGCSQPIYLVNFTQPKKVIRFSKNDTITIKGGILSIKKSKMFINYSEAKKVKFITLGNANDSFLYVINTFIYRSPESLINLGTEIQHATAIKRDYIKLEGQGYKILSVDTNKIVLQKIKPTIGESNAIEPLLRLPDLRFQSISNGDFNVRDFQGQNKLILISIWSIWCSPCLESMPKLDSLAVQFKDKLQVISLNYKDEYDKLAKYTNVPHIIYGKINEVEYKKLHAAGMPYYGLFNNKGELIGYHHSLKNIAWLTSKIK